MLYPASTVLFASCPHTVLRTKSLYSEVECGSVWNQHLQSLAVARLEASVREAKGTKFHGDSAL